MQESGILDVSEVIQAGDIFLIKFQCWDCGQILLRARDHPVCECGQDYRPTPIKLPGRSAHRCLVGTKRRRYLPKATIRRLFDLQGDDCAYCFNPMTKVHVEHIVPLSVGGTNNIGNLVLSCARCNIIAGSLVFQTLEHKRAWIIARRNQTQPEAPQSHTDGIQ